MKKKLKLFLLMSASLPLLWGCAFEKSGLQLDEAPPEVQSPVTPSEEDQPRTNDFDS